ncbi:hypothetical protein EJ04DRAFT_560576 [Polyplosphaeria fusca]|uniref:Uncharacterized protein n=1 Tax=Polyplosphaeria fusca TaxID=682080 RepID=A0A9P4V3J3_9PLEO|nr:hypothetical protein EJ04DRAFT_560576 [Polyplosphaeria fusca]
MPKSCPLSEPLVESRNSLTRMFSKLKSSRNTSILRHCRRTIKSSVDPDKQSRDERDIRNTQKPTTPKPSPREHDAKGNYMLFVQKLCKQLEQYQRQAYKLKISRGACIELNRSRKSRIVGAEAELKEQEAYTLKMKEAYDQRLEALDEDNRKLREELEGKQEIIQELRATVRVKDNELSLKKNEFGQLMECYDALAGENSTFQSRIEELNRVATKLHNASSANEETITVLQNETEQLQRNIHQDDVLKKELTEQLSKETEHHCIERQSYENRQMAMADEVFRLSDIVRNSDIKIARSERAATAQKLALARKTAEFANSLEHEPDRPQKLESQNRQLATEHAGLTIQLRQRDNHIEELKAAVLNQNLDAGITAVDNLNARREGTGTHHRQGFNQV